MTHHPTARRRQAAAARARHRAQTRRMAAFADLLDVLAEGPIGVEGIARHLDLGGVRVRRPALVDLLDDMTAAGLLERRETDAGPTWEPVLS